MRLYLLACVVVSCGQSIATAQSKVVMSYDAGKSARVVISGLDASFLAAAKKLDAASRSKVVAIVVASGTEEDIAKRPAMSGEWKVDGAKLIFEPRFPLQEGTSYRFLLNKVAIDEPTAQGEFSTSANLTLAAKTRVSTAQVAAVYPSRAVLPENQLKFYVHFSAPMTRGDSYRYVKLLDEKGRPIESAFLEIGEELWNPSGTRLTLLFDPGRVKHGLKPHEELGPILEEGKSYTLVVSKAWKDGDGTPLKQEFRKSFKAGPAETLAPDSKTWKLVAPGAGGKSPAELRFPKPMDHALLERVLSVVDRGGKRIAGTVTIHAEETVWRFTPAEVWKTGDYKIVVENILEDLAANRIDGPFEREVREPMTKPKERGSVELPFTIDPSR